MTPMQSDPLNENAVTAETIGQASSNHGYLWGSPESNRSRIGRHCYANQSAIASRTRPPRFRASLLREVLREIRNLFHRIGEIQNRELDRQGISLDPGRELCLPHELQESALACCIRDMQSLYSSRPQTTLIDAELLAQGWRLGAASALRNWNT
jgi:hypothetical protein